MVQDKNPIKSNMFNVMPYFQIITSNNPLRFNGVKFMKKLMIKTLVALH